MSPAPSVLVLGIGNTLMQDDGVGVWAVQTLAHDYALPPQVRILDGGVAGLRLLPEVIEAEDLLIIDAVLGDGPPGTIYRLGPEEMPKGRGPLMSAHEVGIVEVLSAAALLGKRPRTRILGVQPLETRAISLSLSPPLREALPRVVASVVEELRRLGIEVVSKARPQGAAGRAE